MLFRLRSACLVFVLALLAINMSTTLQGSAQAPANPELVGSLAKELGSTPQQAEGAAGALFRHAQSKLSPADWGKVASAVPGMDGLLKAAPAVGGAGAAASAAAALGGAGGLGGLSSVAGSFSKLGLKPELVLKAVPILTNYVGKMGGAGVGQLLAGVLK
jgi:hypothetical protein